MQNSGTKWKCFWKKTLPNRTRGSTRSVTTESELAIDEGQIQLGYFMEATELWLCTPNLLYKLIVMRRYDNLWPAREVGQIRIVEERKTVSTDKNK
jgi:hypothetical protein